MSVRPAAVAHLPSALELHRHGGCVTLAFKPPRKATRVKTRYSSG